MGRQILGGKGIDLIEALQKARLYVICDLGYLSPETALPVSRQLLAGGGGILQLRAKGHEPDRLIDLAVQLRELCEEFGVPFIVNDHLELAKKCGATGVHLGQEDGSLAGARATLGPQALVGRSTHSLAQARGALAEGADYIGFGPLFSTPTKPTYAPIGVEEIRTVHAEHPDLPIFCIGGIKRENLPAVVDAGAKRAVIVSGILQAPDIAAYVRDARALLPA